MGISDTRMVSSGEAFHTVSHPRMALNSASSDASRHSERCVVLSQTRLVRLRCARHLRQWTRMTRLRHAYDGYQRHTHGVVG
jgi:hypothetical protein